MIACTFQANCAVPMVAAGVREFVGGISVMADPWACPAGSHAGYE